MRERFLPKNEHHLFDYIIDIEGHLLDVVHFRERANAPYHVIRSIAVHDDRPQGIAHFAQVGIFEVERAQTGRGVERHGGERLAHFVRDRGSGPASYHPRMLRGILVYGYATGIFSSRKLERATYDSVAFRFIAANDHPDHDTIATFRRRFVKE